MAFGYNAAAVSSPFWAERPPRNQSRSDLPELNLFDAGHGAQAITKNPILVGLGLTVRLSLNAFARTFQIFIEEVELGFSTDITDSFHRVEGPLYELKGRAGFGVFNPAARALEDFSTTRTLKLTVLSTNVTISSRIEYLLYLGYEADLRTCPEPRMDDFSMLQCLRENFLHLWRDKITPSREPDGSDAIEQLYLFFNQSDLLAQTVPCMCECFNWFALVTNGFKFFIVGDGAAADAASYPNAAGCNPWDEAPVPDGFGGLCTLPDDWEDSGCDDGGEA